MDSQPYRPISAIEEEIARHLLLPEHTSRCQLAEQLEGCVVRLLAPGFLSIKVDSSIQTTSLMCIPTEGEAADSDGVTIHFLIHVKNGQLNCLEWYKDDGSEIITMPSMKDIRVFAGE